MSTTDPSPTPDPVEDRLRATLEAEADRHPVTADFGALRTRGDHTVVDLRLPPRRNRARILAAAVVVAVMAACFGAVVARSGDDGQPVTADAPPAAPTGWYLPGDGWQVTSISAGGYPSAPGLVRGVLFLSDDPTGTPQVTAEVYRSNEPDGLAARFLPDGVPTDLGGGRAYLVQRSGGSVPAVDLVATHDDLVLKLSSSGVGDDALNVLVTGWLLSEGQALTTPEGLRRFSDATVPAAPAASPEDVLAARTAEVDADLVLTATVWLVDPDGRTVTYTLAPTSRRRTPTGAGNPAEAQAAGLRPEEVARTFAEAGSPLGPASAAWLLTDGGVVADLPSAVLDVSARSDDPDGETARALVGALRPVSADEWAERVRSVDPDPFPALLSSTLEGAPAAGLSRQVTETTMADDGDTEPTTTAPVPDPATTMTVPADPDAAAADETAAVGPLGALYGLAEESDPLVTPGAFADEVTVGFVGTTDADRVVDADELLDPDRWTFELDGEWGRVGPVSILDRLTSANVTAQHPAPPTPTCTGDVADPIEDDLYAYEATSGDSCLDWFAVVVRVDGDGRIVEVRLRLWEP